MRHHYIDYIVVMSKFERVVSMTMMNIAARWEVQVAVNANDDEVEAVTNDDYDDDAKNCVEERACCCDDR